MINLIVAIGKNNLIGKDNDLPWHYKEDLKYFKDTTIKLIITLLPLLLFLYMDYNLLIQNLQI